MIESITIKNIASFDNNGVQIDDLKKVNFFFGYNGTGKSTIAKYLHNISLPQNKQLKDFFDCSQKGYEPSYHQILIFNDEFIKENFIESATQNGVFSLNQKNEEIDNQIKKEDTLTTKYTNYKNSNANRKRFKTLLASFFCIYLEPVVTKIIQIFYIKKYF